MPLAPWNADKTWSDGAHADADHRWLEPTRSRPSPSHSIPFYNSLPASAEKAYLELRGASHFFPQTANTTMAKYMISWLKRWVDDDTRYDQFLCPAPNDSAIGDYRDTCPHS